MKTFLEDISSDLRARRLWPVAVALLVALIAVPVVLKKSSEAPPPAEPVNTSAAPGEPEREGPKGLASVVIDEVASGAGSSLDTFDPSNPFRPPEDVIEEGEEEAASTGSTEAGPSDSAGDSGSGAPTDIGEVNFEFGEGQGGATTPPQDDGSDGEKETKTTQYAYVIDVVFSANGRKRTINGMEKLDILPNQASPLLIFMGVTDNAGNAVFLVDSTLQAAGEGKCKPSNSECAFLHLGAGAEAEFTNDEGDSYTLLIKQIRRVKLGAKASASKKGKKARAAVGAPPAPRRFSVPFLADLVSESTGADVHSNSDRDNR
jgi:hypothetical protein